jgi:DDE superfamily endonuclease
LNTAVSRACAICSTGWGKPGLADVPNIPNRRPTRWRLLKKLPAQLQLIAAAHPGKTIELWCQDETRVGQKGRRTHGWAPKGSRPPVPIDTRYQNAYIFGAFCPERECAVGLILPRANTAMMQLHLNEISAQLPAHIHAAMITDGAGWHRSQTLRIPSNITLIDIPPYTPQCNPAEKPWQYLKDNFLSHQVFMTYQDILDACQHAWNSMLNESGRIASLTSMHHLIHHET